MPARGKRNGQDERSAGFEAAVGLAHEDRGVDDVFEQFRCENRVRSAVVNRPRVAGEVSRFIVRVTELLLRLGDVDPDVFDGRVEQGRYGCAPQPTSTRVPRTRLSSGERSRQIDPA